MDNLNFETQQLRYEIEAHSQDLLTYLDNLSDELQANRYEDFVLTCLFREVGLYGKSDINLQNAKETYDPKLFKALKSLIERSDHFTFIDENTAVFQLESELVSQPIIEPTIKLSQYQTDAIKAFRAGKNIAIQATAGAGKTFILSQFATISAPAKKACVVFNKHNVSQLTSKFPDSWSGCPSTSHSLFYRLLRNSLGVNRIQVNGFKYHDLARDYLRGKKKPLEIAEIVALFNSYRVSNATDLEGFAEQYVHYEGLKVKSMPALIDCLDYLETEGLKTLSKKVDFTDMIWGYVRKGNPVPYNLVMVDECQDLNPITIAALKMLMPAQFVAMGDRNQAIMGFAGADVDSFDNIKAAFNCEELPLSVCYRCPDSHITLVNDRLPHVVIEGTGKQGQVIKGNGIYEADLILCRFTAPLVSLWFKFVANNIPARIRGRDIGKGLTNIVKRAIKEGVNHKDFPAFLDSWADEQIAKVNPDSPTYEQKLELIAEKQQVLMIFYAKTENLSNIVLLLDQMFTDEERGVKLLSTIHRSKGLEYDNVAILQSCDLPINAHPQELNVFFVALTRAKKSLYLS